MDKELLRQALGKLLLGVLLTALLLFLPPELLRRRLNAKERQTEQKGVIAWSGLLFIASFLLAGFGFRFGWYMLPRAWCLLSAGVFLLGYALFGEVLRENEYLSRTVEVTEGQRVVSTGLYGVVRHPMYFATLLMFLSMPLILGSVYGFLVMLAYLPVLAARIRGEEALLERELKGYSEYKQKVRYRLIPHIW